MESTEKIVLSQDFDVPDWYGPACEELASRPIILSKEEARKIGLDAAMDIVHIREHARVTTSAHVPSVATRHKAAEGPDNHLVAGSIVPNTSFMTETEQERGAQDPRCAAEEYGCWFEDASAHPELERDVGVSEESDAKE